MATRLFLLYLIVEMAVIVGLTYAIGFGWTVLLLAGAFALGIALAGAQVRRQFATLQRGMRNPGDSVTDGALVALGTVLVVVPGLVSSVAGLLLLTPPTRAALRPAASALASRTVARRIIFVDLPGRAAAGHPTAGRGQYIDGEVVDVDDVDVHDIDMHDVDIKDVVPAPTRSDLPAVPAKPE